MTCSVTMTPSPVVGLVRDEHQIRKRLLLSLGIAPAASPSIARGTVKLTPQLRSSTPTDNPEDTTAGRRRKRSLRFDSKVVTHEIPSHRDYDEETRQQIWMGRRELERNARRNRIEYLADGHNYLKVTEEKHMMPWKGELVHPATYWMLYEQEQDELLQEERLVRSSSLKRSTTFSSFTGMAA